MKKILDAIFGKNNNSSVTVNGVEFSADNSISITDKGVYIDGKLQDGSGSILESKKIDIQVHGNVEEMITYQGNTTVMQDVGRLESKQGTVTVLGDALGNVSTNQGTLKVGKDVGGNVTNQMGKIEIGGNVGGDAKTQMGSLIIKSQKAKKVVEKIEEKEKKPNSLFNFDD